MQAKVIFFQVVFGRQEAHDNNVLYIRDTLDTSYREQHGW